MEEKAEAERVTRRSRPGSLLCHHFLRTYLPEIVILPEGHRPEWLNYIQENAQSKFFKHQEQRIKNQLFINVHYRPGDTVYVEEPRDRVICAAKLPATCLLKEGVVVKGWDDPVSIKRLENLEYLFTKTLLELNREDYQTAVSDPVYQESLSHLHKQDVSSWSNQISLTPEELPSPSMDEEEYFAALHKVNFAVKDYYYHLVSEQFIDREKSLEETLARHEGGRAWVLGGRRHFQHSKWDEQESIQFRSITVLHQFLRTCGKTAAIFKHGSVEKAQSVEENYYSSAENLLRSIQTRRMSFGPS